MEPTSSGFSQAVAISEKLMPGDTDNPTPWNEMTLFSPISFSTWKQQIFFTENKNITEKMPSQRQRDTWGGGGIMLWHNNAIGYICPGVPECSTSLLILSTEEVSKGA